MQQLDSETLAARRQEKIAKLALQEKTLIEALKTATDSDQWRLKGLLTSTRNALRWQHARSSQKGVCACGRWHNPGQHRRPYNPAPV